MLDQNLGQWAKSYKNLVHTQEATFWVIFMKLGQNVCLNEILEQVGKLVMSDKKLGH